MKPGSLRLLILSAVVFTTIFLSGCAGGRAGELFAGSSWPGVTVADDTIYVAFQSQVYALDPEEEGRRALWSFPAEPEGRFFAPPAVGNDIVIVTDYDHSVYAIDRTSGDLIWTFDIGRTRSIGGPLLADDTIYFGTQDSTLYSLSAEDGSVNWTFDDANQAIWSKPVLSEDGETLYVTSLDHNLYAVNAATGALEWSYGNGLGGMVGSPTIVGGVLYFGSLDNHIYALEAETQEILWSYETENWVWSSPTYIPELDLLIGGDLDGHVFALSSATGEEAWSFDAAGPVVGAPMSAEREGVPVVYVASDSSQANTEDANLYIFAAETGELVEQPIEVEAEFDTRFIVLPTGTQIRPIPIYAAPVIYEDLVLVGSHTANTSLIYAFNRDTLTEAWDFGIQ